jgi:hypothetical protein
VEVSVAKVKATVTGFVGVAGMPVWVEEGQVLDEAEQVVQARPDLFTSPPATRASRLGRGRQDGDG